MPTLWPSCCVTPNKPVPLQALISLGTSEGCSAHPEAPGRLPRWGTESREQVPPSESRPCLLSQLPRLAAKGLRFPPILPMAGVLCVSSERGEQAWRGGSLFPKVARPQGAGCRGGLSRKEVGRPARSSGGCTEEGLVWGGAWAGRCGGSGSPPAEGLQRAAKLPRLPRDRAARSPPSSAASSRSFCESDNKTRAGDRPLLLRAGRQAGVFP